MPHPFLHVGSQLGSELELDPFGRTLVNAERVREGGILEVLDRLERLGQRGQAADPLDRERAHLLVAGHVGEQVEPALGVHQPVRVDPIGLLAPAGARVVLHVQPPLVQQRVEQAADRRPLPAVVEPPGDRGLGLDHVRQAIQELPHVGGERGFQLGEGVPQVLAERREREALHERAAEVERRQLRQRERRVVEPLERAGVEPPAFRHLVRHVVDRETGFLEGVEVAANGPRRHPGRLGEPADGDAARGLELTQDGPLADDFGVARQPCPPRRRIRS